MNHGPEQRLGRRAAWGLLAALALAGGPSRAAPDDADRFGRFARFVGTDQYDAILYDPRIAPALYALLGGRDKRLLFDALQIIRPIAAEGGYLLLAGHGLGPAPDAAVMAVAPGSGALDVALRHGGEVTLFASQPALRLVPAPVLAAAARWAKETGQRIELRHGPAG